MMKKGIIFALLLGLITLVYSAKAQTTVFCGPEGSATYQMAQDIKTYCKIELNIQATDKLVESFRNLQPGQICFMQYDILQYELENDLRNGKINAENMELLLPLGNEDIHLITLASSNIKDFKDLTAGTKVGIGKEGESMRLTIEVVKNLTKAEWTNVEVSGREAIKALLNKEVDAIFFVGSAPAEKLEIFSKLSGANDKVRLVNITEASLNSSYSPTTIRAKTYMWADYLVDTYASKSVLVSPALAEDKTAEIDALKDILTKIKSEIKILQRSGHPNWRKVNFVFDGLIWNKHQAAIRAYEASKAPVTPKADEKKK